MQFIEYMLWGTIDRNTNKIIDKKTNMIWSIIGFGLILAEPYFAINIIKNLRFKYALNILYTVVAIYNLKILGQQLVKLTSLLELGIEIAYKRHKFAYYGLL